MKPSPILLGLALVALALAAGCAPDGGLPPLPFLGPTKTPTPSPTPTFTPTPTATPTPTPTPTPVPAARIESGDQALFEGDWVRARQEYLDAQSASQDPEIQSAALLGLGRTALLSGDPPTAIQSFERLIETYSEQPHLAEAYFFLGQAYSAQDRPFDAAQAYLNYLALRPGRIDAYVLDLRADALFAAGDYAGASTDYAAALQAPSLLDGAYLQLKMARAYAVSGDTATAINIYSDLYLHTEDDDNKALIDLRLGQAYTDLGQVDQANAAYLDAVNNFPTSYNAYTALLALVDTGVPVDEYNRGLVDYFAGQYGVALAAFDRYLQQPSSPDPGAALYYTGLTQRALGGYPGAVAAWDKVIAGYPDHRFYDDAVEQKAYTQWAYLDQYTQAVQTLLDFVAASPSHPRAGEFLFDAAQVAERAGRLDEAATLWERVIAEYPNYEQANRALFLAGISRYRQGDTNAALATFQRLQGLAANLTDRSMASFWTGKAQSTAGDPAAAQATWEQTAAIDPTGYYSERARDLLRGRPPFDPPAAYDLGYDPAAERQRAEEWLRATFNLPPDTDLSGLGNLANEPALLRGAELWRLGLYADARTEFESLRQQVQGDAESTYRLANYLADLGLYRSATLCARQVLTLAGLDDAATLTAPLFFNHLRFGAYFSDLILPNAQKYGFHPLFLFSVIRQESLFESFAQSSASAHGLMQIIPATGEEIAKDLGWPPGYTRADLFRPQVSVTFGADYLASQRNTFDGDLYVALAAYNGGPGNAMEWRKLANGDPDLFLEVVRFSETRTYLRSIYEIFTLYRQIYSRTP